jgi:hypothetical protein
MDPMPTTLTGLLLFVALLLPGFAYVVGKERNGTGQQLTPFRETAAAVAASISFELIVLAIFALIRILWPSQTPDVGALMRDSRSYLLGSSGHAGHYGQVALWATGMLALSVFLAYLVLLGYFCPARGVRPGDLCRCHLPGSDIRRRHRLRWGDLP